MQIGREAFVPGQRRMERKGQKNETGEDRKPVCVTVRAAKIKGSFVGIIAYKWCIQLRLKVQTTAIVVIANERYSSLFMCLSACVLARLNLVFPTFAFSLVIVATKEVCDHSYIPSVEEFEPLVCSPYCISLM